MMGRWSPVDPSALHDPGWAADGRLRMTVRSAGSVGGGGRRELGRAVAAVLELLVVQARVQASLSKQLGVGAALDELTVIERQIRTAGSC